MSENQTLVASFNQKSRDSRRDGQWRMFRAKDALELGRRQPLADRTQIFGLSQHVPDRVWERSGPADERFQQGRISAADARRPHAPGSATR